MISQNIAETLINITTMLNRFKSFIKKVYEKEWRRNINKKKEQNNCFRKGISQKVEKVLTLEKRSALIFNSRKNLLFFLKFNFYKSNYANIYMSYEKLAAIFDNNTLKFF